MVTILKRIPNNPNNKTMKPTKTHCKHGLRYNANTPCASCTFGSMYSIKNPPKWKEMTNEEIVKSLNMTEINERVSVDLFFYEGTYKLSKGKLYRKVR